MKALLLPAAGALALAIAAACSPAPVSDPVDPAPVDEVAAPEPDPAPAVVESHTVIDVAVANPDLSTLVAALQAAGLEDALKGDGPFTLFAPTNEAFAALPAGTLEDLLKPENKDRLVRVLQYHVVPGKIRSGNVPAEAEGVATPSLNGLDLAVRTTDGGTVMINQATITSADIDASNGIIHVIDNVLIPRMSE